MAFAILAGHNIYFFFILLHTSRVSIVYFRQWKHGTLWISTVTLRLDAGVFAPQGFNKVMTVDTMGRSPNFSIAGWSRANLLATPRHSVMFFLRKVLE